MKSNAVYWALVLSFVPAMCGVALLAAFFAGASPWRALGAGLLWSAVGAGIVVGWVRAGRR